MPRRIDDERRERAREMRASGFAVGVIAAELGIAKSTASKLIRDVPLTGAQRRALRAASGNHHAGAAAAHSSRRRAARAAAQEHGRDLARRGDPRFVSGCMLYWAEGSKTANSAILTNADADMLVFFLEFLRRWYHVPDAKARFSVNCHLGNGLALEEIEQWWLDRLGLPAACLRKASVNRVSSASRGIRPPLIYGTGRLSVASTFVVQSIYGGIQQIAGFDRAEWLESDWKPRARGSTTPRG